MVAYLTECCNTMFAFLNRTPIQFKNKAQMSDLTFHLTHFSSYLLDLAAEASRCESNV